MARLWHPALLVLVTTICSYLRTHASPASSPLVGATRARQASSILNSMCRDVCRGAKTVFSVCVCVFVCVLQVHVIVGEPVPVADLLHAARTQSLPDEELYSAITQRVETHLRQLHARVQLMHQGHTDLATALPDMATVQPAMSGETAGVDKPSQQGMWGNRGWREGSVPVWWSAEKQREWLSTAFNMWHRGWASRMAVLEASEALPALAQ